MPKTLLAVDDSATMRKVLEITFGTDDFRVLTANNRDSALAKVMEAPSVYLIDTVLGQEDGYALCAEIRRRDPGATILLLASRHNPYDAARGRDAGADDFMDKPFDTQQMIDKVKKTILAHEGEERTVALPHAAAPAPAPAPPQPAAPAPIAARAPVAPPSPGPAQRPPAPAAAAPPERARARTLLFGDRGAPEGGAAKEPTPQPPQASATAGQTKPSAAIYPPSRPQPASPPAAPPAKAAPPPVAPAPPTPKPAAAAHAAVASSVNGQLAGKLSDLGLSAEQVSAVMALSREVVERVVWEVVPQLAETLIKEEIDRLTKD